MHHDAAFTTAGIHSRTWRVELLYSVMATSASCWNRAAHAATIHYQRETACQNVINWTDEAAENCRPAASERERAPGLYSVYSDRLLYIRLLGIQFVWLTDVSGSGSVGPAHPVRVRSVQTDRLSSVAWLYRVAHSISLCSSISSAARSINCTLNAVRQLE